MGKKSGMNYEVLLANVNGVRIAYEHGGSSYPLLLMHGYPETRRRWRRMCGARSPLVLATTTPRSSLK